MRIVRTFFFGASLAVLVTAFTTTASLAYLPGASHTWGPSTPNYNPAAQLHAGTIDLTKVVIGDYLGQSSSQPNAAGYGSSGAAVGWDNTWVGPVGNANTNGDALDGLWVQTFYGSQGWWDLGTAYSRIAVFSSQDHGPYLGEGLEYRLFGSNTPWATSGLSPQALITDVYLDGWRTHNSAEDANGNGWLSDDISGVFQFDQAYRYVKLIAWTNVDNLDEPEIDAIGGVVPEPGSLLLIGLGLGILGLRRGRRQSSP